MERDKENLLKIIIQRHGVPDINEWNSISAAEMPKWVKIYNESGVKINQLPCSSAIEDAKQSFVLCSTLERSKHSARLLKVANIQCHSVFDEAELPVINFPILKTTPHRWSIIFRVFWFLGVSKNVESKKAIKNRVTEASQKLIDLAVKHENVLLVGHGIMNGLIARELLRQGWEAEKSPDRKKYRGFKYWESSVFRK